MSNPPPPKKTVRKTKSTSIPDEAGGSLPSTPIKATRKYTPRIRKPAAALTTPEPVDPPPAAPPATTLPDLVVKDQAEVIPVSAASPSPIAAIRQLALSAKPEAAPLENVATNHLPPQPATVELAANKKIFPRRPATIVVGIIGTVLLGTALFSDKSIGLQLPPILRQQMAALEQSSASALNVTSPAETLALEQKIQAAYVAIPFAGGADAQRATVLGVLAELALRRGDAPRAISTSRLAQFYANLVKSPLAAVHAALCRAEAYTQAGHADELAVPASREAEQLIASLPPDAPAEPVRIRLALLQTRLRSQQAVAEDMEDREFRKLALARLKGKSQSLSDQLRGELNGDFQRREKLQAEAASTNDPEKMAQASREKEAFDAKFSSQLKEREELLKKETAEALQPKPYLGERLEAATSAWRQLLQSSGTAGASENAQIRLGLASALVAQGSFTEAEPILQQLQQEAPADPYLLAETNLLLGNCQSQKAYRLVGDAAKPAWEAGRAFSSKALELLTPLPPTPRTTSWLIRAQLLAADFEAALGQPDTAAHLRDAARKAEEDAAKDGGWREILWNARQSLETTRQQLLATSSEASYEQFQIAQAAHLALRHWHGQSLAAAEPTSLAEARAAAQLIISTDLDHFPWYAMLEAPAFVQ